MERANEAREKQKAERKAATQIRLQIARDILRANPSPKQPAQSPPAHASPAPEPTTASPSGLFENEVFTNNLS